MSDSDISPEAGSDTSPEAGKASRWPRLRLCGYRFVCSYWLVYCAQALFFGLPLVSSLDSGLTHALAKLLFGAAVPDGSQQTGSGDRAVDWATHLLILLVAVLMATVWSYLHRKRRQGYPRVALVTQLWVRLHLGTVLISYGAFKVLKSQFPQPAPAQLGKALGDLHPMGLLWSFMGHSLAYNLFTGGLEVAAGALLLFRRTRLLGAALAAGVMANVFMLNMSYDVPVKLGSSHLLMMALLLMWQDRVTLLRMVAKPSTDKWSTDQWPSPRARKILTVVIGGLVGVYLMFVGAQAIDNYRQWGNGRAQTAFYGSYDVELYEKDGATITKEQCGGVRWHRVYVHHENVVVRNALGVAASYEILERDETSLKLLPQVWKNGKKAPSEPVVFSVTQQTGGTLEWTSHPPDGALHVVLKPKKFLLNKRNFRWVSQAPYGR